jgi:hypothetical protein
MNAKRINVVRINGSVIWKILKAKGGNWVAICDPLKLTIQSETWADLMEDIGLTLDALLKELHSSNDLENFMREHGWSIIGGIPARPRNIRFDLPFFPEMMATHGPQRSLYQ